MSMNRVQEAFNQFAYAQQELQGVCLGYIKEQVLNAPDQKLRLKRVCYVPSRYKTSELSYSVVNYLYADRGEIYIKIPYAYHYSISALSITNLYELAKAVSRSI